MSPEIARRVVALFRKFPHIKSIYAKMQVHSKSEAVARAWRDGVIS